jgi:glycosyltransferase involved in cell wall biosynthesis
MRFLFFPGGTFVAGMEIVLQGLMAQLTRMGHEVVAVVSGWNDGDYPARLRASGIPFHEVRLGRFYRSKPLWTLDTLGNVPGAVRALRSIARELRPDVVIHVDTQLLLLGGLIVKGARNVLYLHSAATGALTSRYSNLVLSRADKILCVSNYVRESIHGYHALNGRISVVYNGIELPRSTAGNSHEPIVRLGIIGQMIPRKRHEFLLEAIAILRARVPDAVFSLRIIGQNETEHAPRVRAAAKRLGLEPVIEWVGFQKARDEIYRGLDVVVATAVDEPFGTTILEAGAYGLPVIASCAAGFTEMVRNGETGLLFDPKNVNSLVDALQTIIADEKLRRRLGQAGREHVEAEFSQARMAAGFLSAVGHA